MLLLLSLSHSCSIGCSHPPNRLAPVPRLNSSRSRPADCAAGARGWPAGDRRRRRIRDLRLHPGPGVLHPSTMHEDITPAVSAHNTCCHSMDTDGEEILWGYFGDAGGRRTSCWAVLVRPVCSVDEPSPPSARPASQSSGLRQHASTSSQARHCSPAPLVLRTRHGHCTHSVLQCSELGMGIVPTQYAVQFERSAVRLPQGTTWFSSSRPSRSYRCGFRRPSREDIDTSWRKDSAECRWVDSEILQSVKQLHHECVAPCAHRATTSSSSAGTRWAGRPLSRRPLHPGSSSGSARPARRRSIGCRG